jgi:hypothetical protein
VKPVVLEPRVWRHLRDELYKEHPKSVFLLRHRMKDRLGFMVREHRNWVEKPSTPGDDLNFGYYQDQVHLDFYSEHKRTMFLLKWAEFINRSEHGAR